MRMNNKFRWLPEVIEDMIDFCEKNNLEDSRLGLLHVRTVMLEEIALDQHNEDSDQLIKVCSNSSASSDQKIVYLKNTK